MNNTFSLQQLSCTSNHDANLISRQYKLNLMADFMRMKYENMKLNQSEITNQLSYSSYTLQNTEMIKICCHIIELTQITLINAQKRLQIQRLTLNHIVIMTSNYLN